MHYSCVVIIQYLTSHSRICLFVVRIISLSVSSRWSKASFAKPRLPVDLRRASQTLGGGRSREAKPFEDFGRMKDFGPTAVLHSLAVGRVFHTIKRSCTTKTPYFLRLSPPIAPTLLLPLYHTRATTRPPPCRTTPPSIIHETHDSLSQCRASSARRQRPSSTSLQSPKCPPRTRKHSRTCGICGSLRV